MKKNYNEIIVDHEDMTRRAITCRCGKRWVEEIPRVLLDTEQKVIARCPQCQQPYGIQGQHLFRLTSSLSVEKEIGVLPPAQQSAPVVTPEQEENAVAAAENFKDYVPDGENDPLAGKVVQPPSKAVN